MQTSINLVEIRGLAYIRLMKKVSQRELASLIKKDQAKISEFERFKKNFSEKNLKKLCEFFNVSAEEICKKVFIESQKLALLQSELSSKVNTQTIVKQYEKIRKTRVNTMQLKQSNPYTALLSSRWNKIDVNAIGLINSHSARSIVVR